MYIELNPHLDEWRNLVEWYKSQEQTEDIKYRIKCISDLINMELNTEKDFLHFK